jgi:hypothetical protein
MNVFCYRLLNYFFDFSHYFIIVLPFREFIPGYSSSKLRDATELALKSDSLTIALRKNRSIFNPFKSAERELEYAKFNKDSILSSSEEVESHK